MKTQIISSVILLLSLMLTACAVNAQKVIQWTGPTSATLDTVVNTGTVVNSFTLISSPEKILIQAQVKRASGTLAGTTILQYRASADADWITKSAVGDTLTHSNAATNTKAWSIEKPDAPFWRTLSTGSGTMKATVKIYSHNKSY